MTLAVALDARLDSGLVGGVESIVLGMARGLSRLRDGDEEYLFLAYEDSTSWLESYVGGPARIVTVPRRRTELDRIATQVRRRIGMASPAIRRAWRGRPLPPHYRPADPPRSDGTLERTGARVIHFLHQAAFMTQTPSIYHPHDLQHVHLPEFFSERERLQRDHSYRLLAHQARLVPATTSWGRDDFIAHLDLPPEVVVVVPWAPILDEYEPASEAMQAEVRRRFKLPERFILYPAQTWPHKNHEALLAALGRLRQQGLVVPLVSTGHLHAHHALLASQAKSLGVAEDVRWLGFVETRVLRALFHLAEAIVVPSRFEAASGPVWDGFVAGTAVACSNVTALPDQVGDAGLIFDPDDVDGVAEAVCRLWTDPDLRATLVARGRRRVARYTWNRTARTFRAHYRRLAGERLREEDRSLLAADPGI